MKRNRILAPLGILIFLALSMISQGQTVAGSNLNYPNIPLAVSWPSFTSGTVSTAPFSTAGLNYFQLVAVPTGTVASCSASFDGATTIGGTFTTGSIISAGTVGSCATAIVFTSTAVTPSMQGQLTVTVTGTGSVKLIVLGYVGSTASIGSVTQGTIPWASNISQIGGQNVSLYAVLINGQAATGSFTSGAVRIPSFSGNGVLWITGTGITGSPSGCQVVLTFQASNGGPASSAIATQAFTPANSYQGFSVLPASLANWAADTVIAAFTCTGYASGGTISVGFDPIPGTKTAITGNAGVALDGAFNSAPPANGIATGVTAQSSGGNKGIGTNQNMQNPLADRTGQQFMIPGGSNRFSSAPTSISTNTTTQIVAAPAAGFFANVTDLWFNVTTAGSATTLQLVYGTGSNCATGQTALSISIPDIATGVQHFHFTMPLVPAVSNAICIQQAGTTAGTASVQVAGYVAP